MAILDAFSSRMAADDPHEQCQLDSEIINYFNANPSEFFEQCTSIFLADGSISPDIITCALHFVISTLLAVSRPFSVKIRPDWVSLLSEEELRLLGSSLSHEMCSDNLTISTLASNCVPLFIQAAAEHALPLFADLLSSVTNPEAPLPLRLVALTTLRKTFESRALESLPPAAGIELLAAHVPHFYAILDSPLSHAFPFVSEMVMCVARLIPVTCTEFAEPSQQIRLHELLSGLCGCDSLYAPICSLLLAIVTTYYDSTVFRLEPFLALTCLGIDSQNCETAVESLRVWRKICRLEIAREERNALLRVTLTNLSSSDLWEGAEVQQSLSPIYWRSRQFARDRARRVAEAIFATDDNMSLSAQRLLSRLMYCAPDHVLLAVQAFPPMDGVATPKHFACLTLLCNVHQRRTPVREFLAAQGDFVVGSIGSDDDRICSAALATLAKGVEYYGLYVTPDDLRHVVGLLLSLLSRPSTVSSAAIVCLNSVTEHWSIRCPAYPLAARFDDMIALWDTVATDVSEVGVIESAYLILEHFVTDLFDLDPEGLIRLLDRSVEVFQSTPAQDDSDSHRNCAIRSCSLDLITSIFRASGSALRQQARDMIVFLLKEIATVTFSPIDDFLTVMLAAVEQLRSETAYFLDQLVPLVLSVIGTRSPTALEPAFELMSVLCYLLPLQMAIGLEQGPDVLRYCLEPGHLPSCTHPGSLRAFSSLLIMFPLHVSPEICDRFLEVCVEAREAALKMIEGRGPEGKDVADMDALSEAVILGFTALIYRHSQRLFVPNASEWTQGAETLVMHRPPPVSEHLLEAYFSLLEASNQCYPDWESSAICGALNLLPISWGVSSSNAELRCRGLAIWDIIRKWHEAHS
jgi:hypothetical protein